MLGPPPHSEDTTYKYDDKQQLIREDNQAAGKTWTWTYDADGNITAKNEYAYTDPKMDPDSPTSTVSYTYGDGDWKDMLTQYNGVTISYDDSGNPTNDGTWSYTWQAGRNLVGLTGGGHTIAYTYNHDGIRTSKTVDGVTTNYTLANGQVTKETDGTNTILYRYDPNGGLLSMNLNGTEYYYMKDGQGDIAGLIDNTGAVVVEYAYDAWGKILSVTGSLKDTVGVQNPYRYRGYRFDAETGWYYLQSRYYNSGWERFINADDLIFRIHTGDNGSYIYCYNSPVQNTDPDGHYSGIIGIGFEICLSLNLAVTSAFIGVEGIWYCFGGISNNFDNKGIPWMYYFGGVGQGISLTPANLIKSVNVCNPSLFLRSCGIDLSISLSVSVFLVSAKNFKGPNDYCGPFNFTQITALGVTYTHAADPNNNVRTDGLGVTVSAGFNGVAFSVGLKTCGFFRGSSVYKPIALVMQPNTTLGFNLSQRNFKDGL